LSSLVQNPHGDLDALSITIINTLLRVERYERQMLENGVKVFPNFDQTRRKHLNSIKFTKMGPSFVNKMYENDQSFEKVVYQSSWNSI
jgi:hypothetical protein